MSASTHTQRPLINPPLFPEVRLPPVLTTAPTAAHNSAPVPVRAHAHCRRVTVALVMPVFGLDSSRPTMPASVRPVELGLGRRLKEASEPAPLVTFVTSEGDTRRVAVNTGALMFRPAAKLIATVALGGGVGSGDGVMHGSYTWTTPWMLVAQEQAPRT
jgi:hypothetical protein